MNIIEAIKSGKKFRRKGWNWFITADEFQYHAEDIIADDWEVEPDLLTEEQFEAAVDRVNKRVYKAQGQGYTIHIREYLDELKKELGL